METAHGELGRKGTWPPAPWTGTVRAQQVWTSELSGLWTESWQMPTCAMEACGPQELGARHLLLPWISAGGRPLGRQRTKRGRWRPGGDTGLKGRYRTIPCVDPLKKGLGWKGDRGRGSQDEVDAMMTQPHRQSKTWKEQVQSHVRQPCPFLGQPQKSPIPRMTGADGRAGHTLQRQDSATHGHTAALHQAHCLL